MEPSINLENIKNQKEQNFLNFLNDYRTKNPPYSHTGVGKYSGKFFIGKNDLKKFYNKYNEIINNNINVHLIEQHSDISPIIIDIDLKYNSDIKKREFNDDNIKEIIEIYNDEIEKYFEIHETEKDELIQAFVFERPAPYYTNKDILKDGIHIMYPFIITEPEIQYLIRDNVIKRVDHIFKNIPITNTISNAIDRAVIKNVGWYMYGSTKPGVAKYELKFIYNSKMEIIDKNNYDNNYLPELLSIRNKIETTIIKEEYFEEIVFYKQKKNQQNKKRKGKPNITENEFEEIHELVNMLNVERIDDYNDWLSLGWALHNIDPNNEDLLLLWDDVSKKSEKYEPDSCDREWTKMKDEGVGFGSIHYWAKKDNPEKYEEFCESQIRTYIEKSMTGTNVDIAKVLYKLYKYNYVCSSSKNKKWYRFYKHIWIEDEDGITLRNKISNELVDKYCQLMDYYNKKVIDMEDEIDISSDKKKISELEILIKKFEDKIDKLSQITITLKTTNFINNVMVECKGLFYDSKFEKKLDENHFLFCFKNGVLDLKTGSFRDGKPDDYLSLQCNVNYIKYNENMKYLDQLNDFFAQVQFNSVTKKYMLTFLSSLLEGHNADESFHLWTGSGGNGKSKINELLISAFGNYATKFPITLLTGKRAASSSCQPEVIQSKGKRFAYFEEPSNGEKINIGLMKEFTGGDLIKARGLYSNFIEFKPQFKLVLYCNNLPKVPADDDGSWRRLKVLEFLSKFVDNPKLDNEFKKDRYLSSKIPLWTETFMSILIHYYFTVYKVTGLTIPSEVTSFTEEYQNDNDIYVDFLTEKFEFTDNEEDKILINDVHEDYKYWYTENFNYNKHPTKREMKRYFEKKFGKKNVTTTYFIGFKYKINESNDQQSQSVCLF